VRHAYERASVLFEKHARLGLAVLHFLWMDIGDGISLPFILPPGKTKLATSRGLT
jgi:hypothetical protein